MSIINHEITNNGLSINVNENEGLDQRFFEYGQDGVLIKIIHKGESIDDQQKLFVINAYRINMDSASNQIGKSENINLPVNGTTYNEFYSIIESMPAMQAIHRRSLNGLLEMIFGQGFYAFNPVDNLNPFQPVVFELFVHTAPTEGNDDGVIGINVTDGSGDYEYSLDGAMWGPVSLLSGHPDGDYMVYVQDKDVPNPWFRKQSITLVNVE